MYCDKILYISNFASLRVSSPSDDYDDDDDEDQRHLLRVVRYCDKVKAALFKVVPISSSNTSELSLNNRDESDEIEDENYSKNDYENYHENYYDNVDECDGKVVPISSSNTSELGLNNQHDFFDLRKLYSYVYIF